MKIERDLDEYERFKVIVVPKEVFDEVDDSNDDDFSEAA
jgi:hypothetical protein